MKQTLRYLLMLLAATLFAAPATDAQELLKRVEKNGKYGFINQSGQYVVPCKYDYIYDFHEGLAGVKLNGKFGFIDNSGKLIVDCIYDKAYAYSEGLAQVSQNNKHGFIDKFGNFVISCMYDKAYAFSEGATAVKRNGYWSFIDKSGNLIAPCKYDVCAYSEGLATVMHNGKYGFVNSAGMIVVPLMYEYAYSFSEELACVMRDGKYGYINKQGNTAIEFIYNGAESFNGGLACVNQGKGKFGLIDKTGKEVYPCVSYGYISLMDSKDNEILVQQKKKYGYIDRVGNIIVPCEYSLAADSFDEGLAWVTKKGKYGYINKSGKVIIPLIYADPGAFRNGLAHLRKGSPRRFRKNDKYGYIDHQGNWYDTKEEGLAAIAANPLLAQHEGYPEQEEVTIAQNMIATPAPQTPTMQPKSQPAPQPKPQPKQQPRAEAPVLASVDADIPVSKVRNDKTFAVIVANENYRREQGVEFAKNDGEVFRNYCERTLGIPAEHIHLLCDATLNDLNYEIDWLSKVAKAYRGEAKIIFYYAGHGIPDNSSRTAYLLPVDGYGDNVVTGYRVQELYDRLSALPTQRVLVLLDACFSGAQRDGKMMASARGIAIAPEPDAPKGNLIVFSATQGDQTAYPYREMKHGMFTYFLLKKLQETRGEVTLGELTRYVSQEVERRSIVVNRKDQTPTVVVGEGLATAWNEMLF